jgi:hypothetical protein
MSRRNKYKDLHVTEAGRKRIKSLDFARMVEEMATEGAEADDLFIKTALLMCADENDQFQLSCKPERAIDRFIDSHLSEIKDAIFQALQRLNPRYAEIWKQESVTGKKPSRSELPREISQDEMGTLVMALVPILESKNGQWKDKDKEHKLFEDDDMCPEDLQLFKAALVEASHYDQRKS